MVKISKTSKRVTCKRRYRIEKRIKVHNKKLKKESNKEGGVIKKTNRKLKNFHIPNKFPLKNELLDMAKEQKLADIETKNKLKEARKLQKNNKAAGKPEVSMSSSIDELLQQAMKKQHQFDKTLDVLKHKNPFDELNDANEGDKDRENSRKTFYKEFKKVIDAADVLIEVLDARDPLGSRCPQVEEMIISSGKNKKLVLLLNKIDLVPKENVQAWLKYLRNQYPTIAFKSSTQNQNQRLGQSSVPVSFASENLLSSSQCLGADILVKLLNNYTRINDLKQSITVGIIGLPNVGKSSVINSLKRSHSCMIGSVPGLTRCMQEIKLDKHIKLLDSPGVVMSKDEDSASLALKNCIRIESLEDPVAPITLLLERCTKENLMIRYKIEDFKDANDFLIQIAKRYGKIKKGGVPDILKSAQLILNDWISGKLIYYTVPPVAERAANTKIITALSEAFDIDALLKEEQELLDGMNDTKVLVNGMEITATEPIKVDARILSTEEAKEESESEEEMEDDDEEEEDEDDDDESDSEKKVVQPKGKKGKIGGNKKVIFKSDPKRKTKQKSNGDDVNDDVYKSENIPRSKKFQKLDLKNKLKKDKRSNKMLENLDGLLNSVAALTTKPNGAGSKKKNEPYDFKKDFKA